MSDDVIEFNRERLAELKAKKLPYPDWRNVLNSKVEITPEIAIEVDQYMEAFVYNGDHCPGCGQPHAIKWGLAHGEANCIYCRYPYRANHYKLDKYFKDPHRSMPYHPDGLDFGSEEEDEDGSDDTRTTDESTVDDQVQL